MWAWGARGTQGFEGVDVLLVFTGHLPIFVMMEEKEPSNKADLPAGAKGCLHTYIPGRVGNLEGHQLGLRSFAVGMKAGNAQCRPTAQTTEARGVHSPPGTCPPH